jgi:hypothetical protein
MSMGRLQRRDYDSGRDTRRPTSISTVFSGSLATYAYIPSYNLEKHEKAFAFSPTSTASSILHIHMFMGDPMIMLDTPKHQTILRHAAETQRSIEDEPD